jgi:hypothetical protein
MGTVVHLYRDHFKSLKFFGKEPFWLFLLLDSMANVNAGAALMAPPAPSPSVPPALLAL